MTTAAIRWPARALTAALLFLAAAPATAHGKARRNPVEGQTFTLSPSASSFSQRQTVFGSTRTCSAAWSIVQPREALSARMRNRSAFV